MEFTWQELEEAIQVGASAAVFLAWARLRVPGKTLPGV
jgi:hypothetical protein